MYDTIAYFKIFERIECKSIEDQDDVRFEYFVNEVCPRFKKSEDGKFLIIVSSYLDFVRLRNHFTNGREDFKGVSEYVS